MPWHTADRLLLLAAPKAGNSRPASSAMKGGVGDRLPVMGDYVGQPGSPGDDRSNAESIDPRALGWIGVQAQRFGEPEQAFEVITFLHEVDAMNDIESGDLPEILSSALPSLMQLPERAGKTRQHCQHQSSTQSGNGGSAPAPAPDAFHEGHRPGEDRFVVEKALEVIGQVLGGGVAFGRFFLEAPQTNRLQIRDPKLET